jgi:hypothetical protein
MRMCARLSLSLRHFVMQNPKEVLLLRELLSLYIIQEVDLPSIIQIRLPPLVEIF